MGKIYDKIILHEAVNLNDGKNVYAYQNTKHAPQALLFLIEQMSHNFMC